jgi:hypothetical protein
VKNKKVVATAIRRNHLLYQLWQIGPREPDTVCIDIFVRVPVREKCRARLERLFVLPFDLHVHQRELAAFAVRFHGNDALAVGDPNREVEFALFR